MSSDLDILPRNCTAWWLEMHYPLVLTPSGRRHVGAGPLGDVLATLLAGRLGQDCYRVTGCGVPSHATATVGWDRGQRAMCSREVQQRPCA